MDDDVNGAIRNPPPRLVVGISGASGAVYGARVLDALNDLGVESHLVVTKAALLTLSQETDLSPDELTPKASVVHKLADVGATIASGSRSIARRDRSRCPTSSPRSNISGSRCSRKSRPRSVRRVRPATKMATKRRS